MFHESVGIYHVLLVFCDPVCSSSNFYQELGKCANALLIQKKEHY